MRVQRSTNTLIMHKILNLATNKKKLHVYHILHQQYFSTIIATAK